MANKDLQLMINDAIRKGFSVTPNEDNTAWLLIVPARPRRPSQTLGEYKTADSAWRAAARTALRF